MARASFISLSPDEREVNEEFPDPRLVEALRRHRAGDNAAAQNLCREILAADPKNYGALYLLGILRGQDRQFEEAQYFLGEAIKIKPGADAYVPRGYALAQLKRHTEALVCYDLVLRDNPQLARAVWGRGLALSHLGRHEEALASYRQMTVLEPGQASAWHFLGNAHFELGHDAEAIGSYDRALTIMPHMPDAWRSRAAALLRLDRPDGALESLDRALALAPDHAASWIARADVLLRLDRRTETIACYDRALALRPGDAGVLYARANALSILKRYEEAIADCETLLAVDPHYPYARGILIHSKLQSCDWGRLDQETTAITAEVRAGRHVVSPFNYNALADDAELHLQCARLMVADQYPASAMPLWGGEVYHHERIRIAYVSGDFNTTVVASLMAGVFENHDRSRFEIFAVSFGPNHRSAMRTRLEAGFEHFVDVSGKSDAEIAAMLREHEIDIVVDLMGFTGECRSRIFAQRAAPVQVNYLGFPGSMGAVYIDYIVADRTVIPEEQRRFYDEKVVYLTHCFMPQDSKRGVSERTPSRAEAGLPAQGFVFCSFNNSYKFGPRMLDVWMRLLRAVEGSVLWLPQANETALRNLRHEAQARGVSPERLIFAPLVPLPEDHLARLSLADLFLDTLPYNAHATTSDALLAGVPLLSCLGNSFAGRVAASQLKAVGLNEMIVESLETYETMALRLAREPTTLGKIRARLAVNRNTSSLFDTARFTRNLEAAYIGMWERHQKGGPPAPFSIDTDPTA